MRILFIGEIVGSAGIYCVKALLPELKRELGIDLTIAAAEGATGGFGIGKGHAVYLHKLGVDVITAGDFAYFKRDAVPYFGQARYLLRPANYPYGNPGRGWLVARPRPPHPRAKTGEQRGGRQPAAAAPQPATATRGPVTANRKPVSGSREPAVASREPVPRAPEPDVAAAGSAATARAAPGGAPAAGLSGHDAPSSGRGASVSAVDSDAATDGAGGAADATGNAAAGAAGHAAASPSPAAARANRPTAARDGGRRGAAGRNPAAGSRGAEAARPPSPGVGVITLLGQAGFNRVHLRNPFEIAGGLIDRVKQQTPVVLVDFHATTTSEKVAMSQFLDGKITAMIGTHVRTLSADARLLPGGTAAITHSGRTGSLNSVGGLDPEVETRKFLTQVHEQSRDAWGLLELQGVVLEVGEDGKALSISALRRETTAPEAARKASHAQRARGPGRGRRAGGRR